MNEQTKQSDGKAVAIYLAIWFLIMVFMANPIETWPSVLWALVSGGVILVEVVLVGGWILKKIL